jgi:hypothetical protein
MDDIGELDGVLDEEHGNIVAHNVPVALFCVELDCKASNISNSISGASATQHSRESKEDGRFTGRVGQDTGAGDILSGFEQTEGTECAGTSGMDDSLRNTLMVESMDLDNEILY